MRTVEKTQNNKNLLLFDNFLLIYKYYNVYWPLNTNPKLLRGIK
ncbi:hypothetical protein VCHA41O246_40044 [Vibrio chagasii]|nr:hypothetical protein VCHA41O246_40044 [Vibrio chagasii]